MRRFAFLFTVAFVILGIVPVLAQDAPAKDPFAITFIHESPYYPMRAEVIRVDQTSYGFRVIYRKGTASAAELYIPFEWFVPGGKAALITGDHPSYPNLVVFTKEGKFSHLRLYVRTSVQDPTWGFLPSSPGLAEKFKVEEIKLEY
ncbi:MAG: hypothetical protein NT080_13335 [Spirochaetes bacterium]|nr:hypothetical protein [Spirochaetota bacterium]